MIGVGARRRGRRGGSRERHAVTATVSGRVQTAPTRGASPGSRRGGGGHDEERERHAVAAADDAEAVEHPLGHLARLVQPRLGHAEERRLVVRDDGGALDVGLGVDRLDFDRRPAGRGRGSRSPPRGRRRRTDRSGAGRAPARGPGAGGSRARSRGTTGSARRAASRRSRAVRRGRRHFGRWRTRRRDPRRTSHRTGSWRRRTDRP